MSRDGILILLVVGQFLAPFVLALLLSRGPDQPVTEDKRSNKRGKPPPRSERNPATPGHDDWPLITEFTYRRDRFKRWVLAAGFGAPVLALAGLPLSAIGVLLLCPLYGALMHLRCPGCETATSLKGVTDGHNCLRCGQRLRF